MRTLTILSAIAGLLLYVPLCSQILAGRIRQNFASAALWAFINIILVGSIVVGRGNWLLPSAYMIGGILTALCILRMGGFVWKRFDSFVLALTVICIVVWAFAGPKMATVACTLAMFIAGVPQLAETYRRPWTTPALIYAGYGCTSAVALIAAKGWSIEERFYPSSSVIYCVTVVALASRRYVKGQSNE